MKIKSTSQVDVVNVQIQVVCVCVCGTMIQKMNETNDD